MRRASAAKCERCQLVHMTPADGELPRTCDRELPTVIEKDGTTYTRLRPVCGGRLRPIGAA